MYDRLTSHARRSLVAQRAGTIARGLCVALLLTALVIVLAPDSVVASNGKGKGGPGGPSLPPDPDPVPISTCGTAIAGVECWLFQADSGGTYVLDTTNPHAVIIGPDGEPIEVEQPYEDGQRIFIDGYVQPGCISFCMQGDGCLTNFTVSECPEQQTMAPTGPFVFDDLLSLLDSWGHCAETEPCSWDLTSDGSVGIDDLLILLDGLR